MSNITVEQDKQIVNSYVKKTKIKSLSLLKIICLYLDDKKLQNLSIRYGTDIEFLLFDINNKNSKNFKDLQVRPETIFKINIYLIKKIFTNIFPNIKISVNFEETSKNQKLIHKEKNHYKHDAIITLYNDNSYYQIGLEYNETKTHNNTKQIINDNSRNINSQMFFDLFLSYNEKNNNYKNFMENLIYDIFVIGCSINNDKYFLAKILYLKNYSGKNNYEKEFNLVLTWKRENTVNIKSLFKIMQPINTDTNVGYENSSSYIKHLSDEYDLVINNSKCNYESFITILNAESNDTSQKLTYLRRMLSRVSDLLTEASDEIIKVIKRSNEKTKLLFEYTEEIIKNLHTFNNESIVKIGIENYNKMKK
jgi:hypothetical protein